MNKSNFIFIPFMLYLEIMKKSSLLTTNKYLKDRDTRDKLLRQTVISSSAIEGTGTTAARALAEDKPQPKNTPKPSASAESA
jgi:hypothetical protein